MDTGYRVEEHGRGMERAVLDRLGHEGPRTLDELAAAWPKDSFSSLFLAVDRLSRDGVVRMSIGKEGYRIGLTEEWRRT